jgi:hypothetical protein
VNWFTASIFYLTILTRFVDQDMLMRYHSGLGIGHIGIPSFNRYTTGMEVDLVENTTSLDTLSMGLEAAPLVKEGERSLGLAEEEQQQRDDEQVDEPDNQDSDHADDDCDDDSHSDLEDDCVSLVSIGSSVDLDEGYDD